MQCPTCGALNPMGLPFCLICRSAFVLRPNEIRGKFREWLVRKWRALVGASISGLLGASTAFATFLIASAAPGEPPMLLAAAVVAGGGLAVGTALGLLIPLVFDKSLRLIYRSRISHLEQRIINTLAQALAITPNSADDFARLGTTLYLRGEIEKAQKIFEQGFSRFPDDTVIIHNRALIYAAKNQFLQTLEGLRRAQSAGAERTVAANLALAIFSSGTAKEELAACRKAWEQYPDREDLMNELLVLQAEAGQKVEAIAEARQRLTRNPEDPVLLNNLGVLRTLSGDLAGGQEAFLAAGRHEAFPRWGHHNAGVCYLLQGDFTKARALFKAVLADKPDFTPTLGQTGILFYLMGAKAEGLERIQQAAQRTPGDFEIRHNFASLLLKEEHAREALIEAERALELRPTNYDALLNYAVAAFSMKHLNPALEQARKARELYPEGAFARYNLAFLLEASEQYGEAEAELRQLTASYPNFADGWNSLGVVLLLLGQTGEAAKAFTRAGNLQPSDPSVRINLAITDFLQGDHASALRELESLKKSPQEEEMLDILGHVHYGLKHYEEAIAFWRRLTALEPTNTEVLTNLGIAYFRNDQPAEAVEVLRKVVVFLPRSAAANNNLGLAYAKNQQYDEAFRYLSRVLDIQPQDPIVHSNIGLVEYFRKKTEEAMEHWRKVTELSPEYARSREATWLSAYDDSQIICLPLNRPKRALRSHLKLAATVHEPRYALPAARFQPLLPWADLAAVWNWEETLEELRQQIKLL
jgi:Flp pilus assembly protein TadD